MIHSIMSSVLSMKHDICTLATKPFRGDKMGSLLGSASAVLFSIHQQYASLIVSGG